MMVKLLILFISLACVNALYLNKIYIPARVSKSPIKTVLYSSASNNEIKSNIKPNISKIINHLPNIFTVSRVLAIPPFIYFFALNKVFVIFLYYTRAYC